MTAVELPDAEIAAFVDECAFVVDGEWAPDAGWSYTYCGEPAVDDEPPLCAGHIGGAL